MASDKNVLLDKQSNIVIISNTSQGSSISIIKTTVEICRYVTVQCTSKVKISKRILSASQSDQKD